MLMLAVDHSGLSLAVICIQPGELSSCIMKALQATPCGVTSIKTMLFHQLSVHGPTPHGVARPRVSVDLRYLPANSPHRLVSEVAGRPLLRAGKRMPVDVDDWKRTSYSTDRQRRGMCGQCGSRYKQYPEKLLGPKSAAPQRWTEGSSSPLATDVHLVDNENAFSIV